MARTLAASDPSIPPPTEPRPTVPCEPPPHPEVLRAEARERLWREWAEAEGIPVLGQEAGKP